MKKIMIKNLIKKYGMDNDSIITMINVIEYSSMKTAYKFYREMMEKDEF